MIKYINLHFLFQWINSSIKGLWRGSLNISQLQMQVTFTWIKSNDLPTKALDHEFILKTRPTTFLKSKYRIITLGHMNTFCSVSFIYLRPTRWSSAGLIPAPDANCVQMLSSVPVNLCCSRVANHRNDATAVIRFRLHKLPRRSCTGRCWHFNFRGAVNNTSTNIATLCGSTLNWGKS